MSDQQGFSIPELLITLFIGAVFVLTGYQLYGLIIADGGNSRAQITASTLAYQTMRQNQAIYARYCYDKTSYSGPLTQTLSTANPGLPTPFNIVLTVSCPYFSTDPSKNSIITKVQVRVNYADKGITHAIYATPN